MAVGGEGPRLATAVISDWSVGWTPFHSPFTTQWVPSGEVIHIGGPVFESADNLRWHDGVMQMRQASQQLNPAAFQWPAAGPELVDNLTEQVYFIFQIYSDVGATRIPRTILVTTAEIHVWDGGTGAWSRVTPQYNSGQIGVTNGSTTVDGVFGTNWADVGISKGMIIEMPNGDHHLIDSVSSNSLLFTATPYGGPTDPSSPYRIRRVFFGGAISVGRAKQNNLFARLFNGDLYVAGNNVGGEAQPAVLIWSNVLTSTAPATYLMSDTDLDNNMTGAGSVISEDLDAINGLDILQDGRVVVATEENIDRLSRIRYSSPLNVRKWNLSPAGFTDVVAGGDRNITGIERLGRVLAIHYDDTIVVGQPTGQDDPPLAFDSSRAETGATWNRSLQTIGNQQMFIDNQGIVHTWTGSGTQEVTQAFRKTLQKKRSFKQDNEVVAWIDTRRQEYQFAVFPFDDANIPETRYMVGCVNYRTGAVRREFHPREITGASDRFINTPGFTDGGGNNDPATADWNRDMGSILVGGTKTSGDATPALAGDGLFRLRERVGDDFQWNLARYPLAAPSPELITYPLDFGAPGAEKAIERVTLVVRQPPDTLDTSNGTQTISIRLARDDGDDYEQVRTLTFDYILNDTKPRLLHFEFNQEIASEAFRISILFGDPSKPTDEPIKWLHQLTKMWIRFALLGEVEGMNNPSAETP